MQIDDTHHSRDAAKDPKITDKFKSPHAKTDSESMPIDEIPRKKSYNEIESPTIEDVIDYDPNEVPIEECCPVVEEQNPSINQASFENSILKHTLRKNPFRWVDLKTFYNPLTASNI
ncbi:hypothetical protein AVEN_128045-1 [Araneus ventricosus]|uniref:Uncharacterized protein n=1 Tax=Araneus ventricosus TaxID=182803 RepID=A0A4Y2A0D5_ARAVE|nr:hypothetical protein AVEN_128045-1 [Araneus ventricosus]